jgi:hypothetical protein
MNNRAFHISILEGVNGNKFPSLLFLSAFIALQSLLILPSSGQNGISACQPESLRTETSAKFLKKKDRSYSFIKLFFQLNNSLLKTGNRREGWFQARLNYSLKINQALLLFELLPDPLPIYFRSNISHQNQDEFPLIFLS